jgi:hypothetical protein
MDMVEIGMSKEETGKRSIPQSERSSRDFSSKKHIFDKAPRGIYQSQ